MKIQHSLALCLIACGAASWARAQDIKFNVPGDQAPAPAAAGPAAPALTNSQLSEEFGWYVAKRIAITDFQFSPSEIDAITKGFAAAVNGGPAPYDFKTAGPAMFAFMQKKQLAYLQQVKQQNTLETAEYFAKLKDDKDVVELPSGLRYKIMKPGDGPYPQPTDTVKVHYTGTLLNGTVFDSSVQRGQPVELQLGDQVIPGWAEGLQKINKGGKIRLFIPPQLAYGDAGQMPAITPGASLIFDVELIDFRPTPPGAPSASGPAGAPPQGSDAAPASQ